MIPIAALALCLVFLPHAEVRNLILGGIALVIGAGVYALRRRPEKGRRADARGETSPAPE